MLKPGGRLILVEPWVTPGSWFIYKYFHHEYFIHVEKPFENLFEEGKEKDPWLGNAYTPFQIFCKDNLGAFQARWPNLKVLALQPFSSFAYVVTGGFQPYGVRSELVVSWLLKLEHYFQSLIMPLSAFRILIVLEKA